ncbi:MAG: hypothetical protein K2K34_07920 [Oscillospiraceae bacterium]|nr:hypothetical protein [Oscillospiraceae bacterium]
MKKYTIIGGVNGAGKSSLTGVLRGTYSDLGVVVDTDSITERLGADRIAGGKKAVGIINDCLEKGVNFTQETTLSGKKTLRTVLRARERDYFIRLYYVAVSSAEESSARIANRVRKGGHDIPERDVIRRFEKRFEDLARILPYCDEVHFYDNENGFIEVGEYRHGSVILSGEYVPDWISRFKQIMENNLI